MFVTFGEIMMRIAPFGQTRFRQAFPGAAEISFTGAEANVAASLAMFGAPSRYFTALPRSPITESLVATLRGLGIDTSSILWRSKGRLGVYFVETGANQRGSMVHYDRDYSAVSLAEPEEYDFESALAGAQWLHVTGITPSLGESAFRSTLALVRLAQSRGIPVSCDLNFRSKLWRWRPGTEARALAQECMSAILPFVSLLVANEEDAADVLGIHAQGSDIERGRIDAAGYEGVARAIKARFPNLRKIACTLRESVSADHNLWGAMLFDVESDRAFFAPQDSNGQYRPHEIRDIVDRVGAGDSFVAGLIHALHSTDFGEPARALEFATAASCLKHSIRGDFNYVTREEVASLAQGQSTGRVRR